MEKEIDYYLIARPVTRIEPNVEGGGWGRGGWGSLDPNACVSPWGPLKGRVQGAMGEGALQTQTRV